MGEHDLEGFGEGGGEGGAEFVAICASEVKELHHTINARVQTTCKRG